MMKKWIVIFCNENLRYLLYRCEVVYEKCLHFPHSFITSALLVIQAICN